MRIETDPPSSHVASVARYLLAAKGSQMKAHRLAEARCAPSRVAEMLKSVGAAHLSDTDFGSVLADWGLASAAFFTSLRTESVFFRLLDAGFVRVPFDTRIGVATTGATAATVAEGRAIPVSRLTLAQQALPASLVAALIVVSDEVASSMSDAAGSLVTKALREAVAVMCDLHFFDLVIDSATPSMISSGDDLGAMKRDLKRLLDAVNTTGAGELAWVMGPTVANGAAFLDDRDAMTPTGGELLGLPAIVSTAAPAGVVRLVNAGAIAANADAIDFDGSRQATLAMSATPLQNGNTGTGEEMVSLFQANLSSLRARVRMGTERLRDDAIAEMTGVAWGAEASGS